jgi:hypothetical protein
VTRFLDFQNTLNPGNDFVRRRVGRFVQVDNTVSARKREEKAPKKEREKSERKKPIQRQRRIE